MIFSSTISTFLILLLVWNGLYTAFDIDSKQDDLMTEEEKYTKQKRKTFNYYIFKKIIIVILFFIYPSQIIFSYFRGSRDVNGEALNIALLSLVGLLIIFVATFMYYTCKLKNTLSRSYETPKKQQNKLFNKTNGKSNICYLNHRIHF
jgi:uncharacterized integral membrane protein